MSNSAAHSRFVFMRLLDTFSIRKKLLLVMMIASCFAMLVTGTAFTVYQTWYFNARLEQNLISHAEVIAYNSKAALAFIDHADGQSTLQSLQAVGAMTAAVLYDDQGQVFAVWQRDNIDPMPVLSPPDWQGVRHRDGEILVSRYVEEQGQRLGTLLICSGTSEKAIFLKNNLIVGVLLFLATAAITFALAHYLQAIISRPVKSLSVVMARISETRNYSLRSEPGTGDELGQLSVFFNEMLDRIEDSDSQLRENRGILQAIIDNAGSVIYLKDPDGRYLLVNRRFREVVVTRGDGILGRTDYDLFPAELAEKIVSLDQKVLAEKCLMELEETAPHADGNHIYLSARFPLRDRDGKVYAVCGISTDITERKQAENELRKLRNYLDNVINSMPSALIGLDAEGKITRWNYEAERLSGLSEKEAAGCLLDAVLPQFTAQLKKVQQAIAQRQVQESDRISFTQEGKIHFKEITVYPLVANGIEGAVLRVDDVTERVQIEEMMIQTEKMMSVGGLAAGMAHEINNPLGIMVQAVQNIERRVSLELPENIRVAGECGTTVADIHAYLEKRMVLALIDDIREAGARAARIVSNMLQFSRRSDSSASYACVPELIEQTIELAANDYDLKKKYDFRHIDIKRDYASDLPEVKLVVTEFEQVMLNLLKNSAQAMSGKRIGKKAEIRIVVTATADTLRVVVEDNGSGMEKSVRKRVFEPFFTTKPVGSGTGLGLSVSYMIITNNHNGSMEVESTPGKGSRFTIALPLGEDLHGTSGAA